mgnify:FL=1
MIVVDEIGILFGELSGVKLDLEWLPHTDKLPDIIDRQVCLIAKPHALPFLSFVLIAVDGVIVIGEHVEFVGIKGILDVGHVLGQIVIPLVCLL